MIIFVLIIKKNLYLDLYLFKMFNKLVNLFRFENRNRNYVRGLSFWVPTSIFLIGNIVTQLSKSHIILGIGLMMVGFIFVQISLYLIKKADKIDREMRIREMEERLREIRNVGYYERGINRKSEKEIKRVYSENDPYGEEDWEN